jgi:Na+-driven multidrug efflux pump
MKDFGEGRVMKLEGKSLKRDFFKFILPAVASQWVFALYTMVDGMFVARGVSETALAAVNISSPFVTGMFALSLTFAVGTSTIVALMFGQNKIREAREVFSQNMTVLTIVSLLITAAVLAGLKGFAGFLGATEVTMPYVKEYISTIAPFAVCFILSYSFEILISTDGYPALATIIVSLGVVLNCILDYLLVMVWHKGVSGAAFATGISQTVVIVFYLKHFLGKKGTIKFCRHPFRPGLIARELKNGFPSGITELSAGIITFVFNQAIIRFLNEDAIVSYSIIAYVNAIVVMSMVGVAQGCQPLISYYYGKGEREKCRRLLKYELCTVAAASVFAVGVCYLLADKIVGIFISPELEELSAYSAGVFRIFILSFLLAGYNVVAAGFFTAIEKSGTAVVISLGRGLVMLVVSMAVLTTLFGGKGIWWAAALSEALCLVVSIRLLKPGT